MLYPRIYQEMSTTRDATQTVKQKFDALTELIEEIDQKMDHIVARINAEGPRDTAPPPRAQGRKFRVPARLTAVLAATVATVAGFTAKACKSS
jgi:hypothetical protein